MEAAWRQFYKTTNRAILFQVFRRTTKFKPQGKHLSARRSKASLAKMSIGEWSDKKA
jgi:hypothetical protein